MQNKSWCACVSRSPLSPSPCPLPACLSICVGVSVCVSLCVTVCVCQLWLAHWSFGCYSVGVSGHQRCCCCCCCCCLCCCCCCRCQRLIANVASVAAGNRQLHSLRLPSLLLTIALAAPKGILTFAVDFYRNTAPPPLLLNPLSNM